MNNQAESTGRDLDNEADFTNEVVGASPHIFIPPVCPRVSGGGAAQTVFWWNLQSPCFHQLG